MKIKSEVITSRQNPSVRLAASLSEKKYRDEYKLFRTDGIKLAQEVFSRGIIPEAVLLRESSVSRVMSLVGDTPECDATVIADSTFDKISDEKSPEGIICIIKHLDNLRKIATINKCDTFSQEIKGERIMLLESIRDPGNIGTVIRSASALGCDRLVLSDDCADVYNPKTVRASMGAILGLKIDRVDSLCRTIELLREQGRSVYAAALDHTAVGLDALSISGSDCFVVGNEGHGLSKQVLEACNKSVFIPITSGAESLNAAIAAAIILWEQKRQVEKFKEEL